jgi:hypothetical protein
MEQYWERTAVILKLDLYSSIGILHRPKQSMFGPAATTTYCLPSSMKVIGDAFMKMFVGNSQSVLPVR